jgi:hypothetical protein
MEVLVEQGVVVLVLEEVQLLLLHLMQVQEQQILEVVEVVQVVRHLSKIIMVELEEVVL